MLVALAALATSAFVEKQAHVRGAASIIRTPPAILHLTHEKQAHGHAWQTREEWALIDDLPAFTVEGGKHTVTFMSALAASNPVLSQRSPEELRSKALILERQEPIGCEPKLLRSATRRADGRWTGTVDGHTRTFHVASEGRLASGHRFLESLTGEILQLELPRAPAPPPDAVVLMGSLARLSADQTEHDSEQDSTASAPAAWAARQLASLEARVRGGARDGVGALPVLLAALPKLQTLYVVSIATCALLVGGQLTVLAVHEASPAGVRAAWQQRRVSEARGEVLQLERWLERRGAAFSADQERFVEQMGTLEPLLRESEARLAELQAAARAGRAGV